MVNKFFNILFFSFILSFLCISSAIANSELIQVKPYTMAIEEINNNATRNVYLIVDNRDNKEATYHVAEIAEILLKEKKIKFAAIEGFEGNIDTSVFSSFPNPSIRKTVAELFLSRGIISPMEYLSVVTDQFFMLYGIETYNYYREFLHQYHFRKITEAKQNADGNEYQKYFVKRQKALVDNFIYQLKSKDIQNAILVTRRENVDLFKKRFKDESLNCVVLSPRIGKTEQNFSDAYFDTTPSLKLLREEPVYASPFEYKKLRVSFMDDYISKLLMTVYLSGEDMAHIKKLWSQQLSQLIDKKKRFYQEFFVKQEKEILSEEIFSLFNVLDTQMKEFDGILADIDVNEFVKIYADQTAKIDEFLVPVIYYNTKKTLVYYFFKSPSLFTHLLIKDKKYYPIQNLNYAVLESDEFFNLFLEHQKQFLPEGTAAEKMTYLSHWRFLNMLQKQYLLISGVISLPDVFADLKFIVDNVSEYGDEKAFRLETEIVSLITALSEFCIFDENNKAFLSDVPFEKLKNVENSLKISIIASIQVLRLGNPNKGVLDLIIGDILYAYEDSLKEAIYGELRIAELKKMLTVKAKLLCSDLLKENDTFGIVENISRSLYSRLKKHGSISVGRDGIVSAGEIEYDLTSGGVTQNEEFFLKRLTSYTAAIGKNLKDFLSEFDFSRMEFKQLSSVDEISFVFALAYLQQKIKELNKLNDTFQLLAENNFEYLNQLLLDVDVLRDGFVDNRLVNVFLKKKKKLFVFSPTRESKDSVTNKLIRAGFINNELDNEIGRVITIVDLERYFSTQIAVITNVEDIVKKAVLDVTIRKEVKKEDVFLFLGKGSVNVDLRKTLMLGQSLLIPRGVLLAQLFGEFYAKHGGTGKKGFYVSAGYLPSEVTYLLQSGRELVREPRTKFLLNLFVQLKDKLNR